jgi:uncharacterized protein (TIRG00374 family)
MDQSSANKRIQFWIGIVVSAICLAAVFLFVNPKDIWNSLSNSRFELWAVTALSLIIFMLFRAIRWQFMLNYNLSKEGSVSYSIVFHIQNIGYMLTNILPFRLGDLARAVLIGNVPPLTISRGFSTMVAERVFDLLFFVILFPFALSTVSNIPPELRSVIRVTGGLAIVAAIILVLAANQRELAQRIVGNILGKVSYLNPEPWLRRLDDLLLGLGVLTRFRDGLKLVILSILVWLPIIVGYYVGMQAVNLDPTWMEAILVVCIAAFSVTAPSSPGQIGVFEASVTFAISGILSMPSAAAASFALLYHAVNYIVIGALGVLGIIKTGETFGSVITSARALIQSRPE